MYQGDSDFSKNQKCIYELKRAHTTTMQRNRFIHARNEEDMNYRYWTCVSQNAILLRTGIYFQSKFHHTEKPLNDRQFVDILYRHVSACIQLDYEKWETNDGFDDNT